MNTRLVTTLASLSLLGLLALPASAQYVGPAAAATDVKTLQGSLFDRYVTLTGHITRQLDHDLYEFSDGTGSMLLDVDHDHDHKKHHGFWPWPMGAAIDQSTTVEIQGKYVGKALGYSKVKVIAIRVVK